MGVIQRLRRLDAPPGHGAAEGHVPDRTMGGNSRRPDPRLGGGGRRGGYHLGVAILRRRQPPGNPPTPNPSPPGGEGPGGGGPGAARIGGPRSGQLLAPEPVTGGT